METTYTTIKHSKVYQMPFFLIKHSLNHPTNAGLLLIISMVISCFSLLYPLPLLQAQEFELTEQTVLTMGSWRTDDIVQIRHILDVFEKQTPGIRGAGHMV